MFLVGGTGLGAKKRHRFKNGVSFSGVLLGTPVSLYLFFSFSIG